jgi:insulysin
MDVRGMEMTFPFPEQSPLYATKVGSCVVSIGNRADTTQPGAYLVHFLGHGGPGSALSYLKRRKWANSVRAGFQTGTSGFEFFKITLDLTVDGLGRFCLL